jgi:hypothetical protein
LSLPDTTQWERYGPFGAGGNDVGHHAIALLWGLRLELDTQSRPEAPRWDDPEVNAFEDLAELTTGIRFIEPQPELAGSAIGALHRDFQRLFAATPFSQSERDWMLEPPTRPTRERGTGDLIGKSVELLDAGVFRVIEGEDLARRWWAWRRERDEFAGQGSLEVARQALGAMSLKLVSEQHWPRQHQALLEDIR